MTRWQRLVRGWPAALARQWALLLVLLLVGVGIVLVLQWHWRRGAMVIGGATGLAGLLRLVLPERWAGLLVLRRRFWDVAVLGATGLAMIVLAPLVPPN